MEDLTFDELKETNGGDVFAYWEALGDAINAMNNSKPDSTSWNDSLWLRSKLWVEMESLGYLN